MIWTTLVDAHENNWSCWCDAGNMWIWKHFPKDMTSVVSPLKRTKNISLWHCVINISSGPFKKKKEEVSCLFPFCITHQMKSLAWSWGAGINRIRRHLLQAPFKWPLDWDTNDFFLKCAFDVVLYFWYAQPGPQNDILKCPVLYFTSPSQTQRGSFTVSGRCPSTRHGAMWWYVFIQKQPFHFSSNLI